MPISTRIGKIRKNNASTIWLLIIVVLLLSVSVAIPVGARPPPPEYWAGYMLPQLDGINSSIRSVFTVTVEPVPEFPNLSSYYASRNILYEKTGDHYVTEVWYFTDPDELSAQTARLRNYLASHGNVSDTTLDLLPELTQFSTEPWLSGYYAGQLNYSVDTIPAIRYWSNDTSGYFVILPNHYYIAYYGRTGSQQPENNSSILKVLMMTVIPSRLAGEFGNPIAAPGQNNPLSLLLSPFWGMVFLLIVVSGFLVTDLVLVYRKR